MTSRFVSTVVGVKPHSATESGNVRQEVAFEGHFSYLTAPDSFAGNLAQNLRPGDFVEVTLDDAECITHLEVRTLDVFWLSFVDTEREEGDRFLGVAIVQAASHADAVQKTWALGINPGGEVLISPVPSGTYREAEMNRLLDKDEATSLAAR